MSAYQLGKNSSEIEVVNISQNGFWLLSHDKEMFLGFDKFPWFKKSSIDDIFCVDEIRKGHYYWEKLDIDLTDEIINNPERFPLIANIQ